MKKGVKFIPLTVDIMGVASAASVSFMKGLSGALSILLNEIVSNSDLKERDSLKW